MSASRTVTLSGTSGGTFSIQITGLTDDTTTTFYATATDAAGNVSAVSSGVTYVEDSTAPGAPTSLGTTPASPANNNSPSVTGSVEAGKRADIAIVDFDSLNQTPFYNVYSHLVYATKANDVRTVIINGRVVMLDRRLLTLNENVIKIDANAYRKKIIESLKN